MKKVISILLSLMLAIPSIFSSTLICQAKEIDEYQYFKQATVLNLEKRYDLPMKGDRSSYPNKYDYYSFEIPSAGTVNINCQLFSGNVTNGWVVVEIYEINEDAEIPSAKLIQSSQTIKSGNEWTSVPMYLNSGKYYIRNNFFNIFDDNKDKFIPQTIINFEPKQTTDYTTEIEHNDNFESANTILPNSTVTGRFLNQPKEDYDNYKDADDVDCFKLEIKEAGELKINVSEIGINQPYVLGFNMQLFRVASDGSPEFIKDFCAQDPNGYYELDIDNIFVKPGTYFIVLYTSRGAQTSFGTLLKRENNSSGDGYIYTEEAKSDIYYELTNTIVPFSSTPDKQYEAESNNSIETANELDFNTTIYGNRFNPSTEYEYNAIKDIADNYGVMWVKGSYNSYRNDIDIYKLPVQKFDLLANITLTNWDDKSSNSTLGLLVKQNADNSLSVCKNANDEDVRIGMSNTNMNNVLISKDTQYYIIVFGFYSALSETIFHDMDGVIQYKISTQTTRHTHNFQVENNISKCTVCGLISPLESSHNYDNNMNNNYYYSCNEADSLKVTFSNKCKTEANYDFISIYDGNEELVGRYSGTELAGKTITIPTGSFRINMTSDSSQTYYGFMIENISIITYNHNETNGSMLPQSEHNYANGADDTYTYTIPNAKSIKITFSSKCMTESKYDLIYIYNKNGTLYGKYSGNTLAGKTVTIYSDTIRISIKSDNSQNYYGFSIDNATACLYNGNTYSDIDSQPVYIESSHNYANNLKESSSAKEYSISNAKSLAVKFSANTKTEANYDFIYIYDENNNLVGKYSGTQLAGKTVIVNGSKIKITMSSDGSQTFYGYSIDKITPKYNESIKLNNSYSNVTISSGLPQSAHNYTNNMNNNYSYEYPNATELKLTFSSKCKTEDNYDFIYIYDGNGKLVGKYSGTQLAGKTITIPTGSFKINMTSDRSQAFYGFSIDKIVAKVSQNTTNSKTKNVSSSIAPATAHEYRNSANDICYYSNPYAKSYSIKFNSNTKTEANYDFIYIYNEDTGALIGKYSGTQLAGKVITINASKFSIKLTSDGSATYYGYSLDYITTNYDTNDFVINNQAYPESNHKYENNLNSTYKYKSNNNNITGLSIKFSSKCYVENKYDFIYIYDGNDNLVGKFTGSQLANQTIYVPTNNFSVVMTSDRSGGYYGFSIDNIIGHTAYDYIG